MQTRPTEKQIKDAYDLAKVNEDARALLEASYWLGAQRELGMLLLLKLYNLAALLLTWRDAKRLKIAPDRIIVETTGLADPAPILHGLTTDARLRALVRPAGVVAVVDALKKLSKPTKDRTEIEQVGAISANNDDTVGRLDTQSTMGSMVSPPPR
mgnify:CR=1 FL=1